MGMGKIIPLFLPPPGLEFSPEEIQKAYLRLYIQFLEAVANQEEIRTSEINSDLDILSSEYKFYAAEIDKVQQRGKLLFRLGKRWSRY